MASAADNRGLIHARVDAEGRLVQADPMLLDLQEEAGAKLGDPLILPQLAALARLATRLGIPVARAVLVASRDHDIEMWANAEPVGEGVGITVERWLKKVPQTPRLELVARNDERLPAAQCEWSTDAELRLTELSDDLANLVGAKGDEAIGHPLTKWLQLVEDDDGSMPLLVAVASRSKFAGQHAVGRHGSAAKLILSGHPILGPEGKLNGFRGSARTEENVYPHPANEEEVFGLDPALDSALQTPIDRIITAAEGIASRSDGPLRNDYAVYAGDIAAAARHLASVIRSLVAESAEPSVSVDAVALADEAIAMVESQAHDKRLDLRREGVATMRALGETRSIIQILVNLLGNAVRHSPEGGMVTLELKAGTDFACWTVVDQGRGVAHQDQERIFERFERAGENSGSSGLGLAIARRLARSMGGDITLVSTPGEGARFTLSLPLAS